MTKIPDLMELLKSGVHFGHQLSKRNPKMKPYIFTAKSGFHIINLEETQVKLKEALAFVNKVVSGGGTILFLGTKRQAQPIVKKYAEACNMPYITERWLGGTLTNFSEISGLTRKFTNLKKQEATGELEKYTKKEKLELEREMEKLEKIVGGIEAMTKVPDAVFVVDIKKEKTAVAEAMRRNIPVVALCDTNVNPDNVDYVIPANDDAVKSIDLITKLVSDEIIAASKNKSASDATTASMAEKK